MSKQKQISLAAFFFQNKRILLYGTFTAFLAAFCLLLLMPPKYCVNALFKEDSNKNEMKNPLKEISFFLQTEKNNGNALTNIVRSRHILKPIIGKFGLQVTIPNVSLWKRMGKNVRDNLLAEFSQPLYDEESFEVRDVVYEGEVKKKYFLCFQDSSHYVVKNKSRKVLKQGEVGKEVFFEDVRCVIQKVPKDMDIHRNYLLRIVPWQKIYETVKTRIKVVAKKHQEKFVELQYVMRDRHLAAEVLNEVIQSYIHYLEHQLKTSTQRQIEVMQEHQHNTEQHLYEAIVQRADELQDYVDREEGHQWIKRIEDLVREMEEYQKRIFSLDLAIGKIEKNAFSEDGQILGFESKIEELTRQKNELLLEQCPQNLILNKEQVIQDITEDIFTIEQWTSSLTAHIPIEEKKLHCDPKNWIVQKCRKLAVKTKEDGSVFMIQFLQDYREILLAQKKRIEPRLFFSSASSKDCETLMAAYLHWKDEKEAIEKKSAQMDLLKQQLKNRVKSSVLIALCINEDMQKFLRSMEELEQKIIDKNNYTEKEIFHFVKERNFYRKIFYDYLHHTHKILEVQKEIVSNELASAHATLLGAIEEQIVSLREQKNHRLNRQKNMFLEEREKVQSQYLQAQEQLEAFPQKWKEEKLFDLHTVIQGKVSQYMTQFLQSHMAQLQMQFVDAQSFDPAIASLIPLSSHVFFLSFSSAIFVFFSIFSFLLFKKCI